MDLLKLALGTAAAWILLTAVFVPLFGRRVVAATLPQRPRRLAILAVAETLASIAFWLTLSVLLSFAIVAYLTQISPGTAGEARDALDAVDNVAALIGRLSQGWSVVASCVILCALVVWSYRRVKRVEAKRLSQEVGAELARVVQEAGAGGTFAAPGPAAKVVQDALAARRIALQQVETAATGGSTDPQIQTKATALRAEITSLELTAAQTAVMETAYDRVAARKRQEETERKRRRFAIFLASEGMLRTMSVGLKLATILVLLLSVPASLVVSGPIAADLLGDRAVFLSDEMRKFQLVAELSTADEEFQAMVAAEPASEPASEISPEDAEIADGLARIFESDVAPNAWNPSFARIPVEVALQTRASSVRETILARQIARSQGLTASGVAAVPEAGFAREANDLLQRSNGARSPTTEVGRLAAAENRRLAVERPQLWGNIRSSYQSYVNSFGRLAPPQQIRGLAISQALGDTIGSISGTSDSFFGQQLRGAGGNLSADAAKAYVQAAHHRFVVEIARSGDIVSASERAAQIGQFATAPEHASALRQVAALTPENARLMEAYSPRTALHVADHGDAARAGAAVQRLARSVGGQGSVQLADAVASFEDYFPGNQGDEQRSRRAIIAREAGLQGAPPAPGAETPSYTRQSRSMASRAVSFRSLRGFARVGGVLIGREPEDGSTEADHFSWRLDENGFSFEIAAATGITHYFGPYRPSTVNLALAYAADGRPTTVTMVSAAPLVELKILTHPTLVDTAVGCRARRLDQFADEMTSEDEALGLARQADDAAARAEMALYAYAHALRIADYASSPVILAELQNIGGEGLVTQATASLADADLIAQAEQAIGIESPLAIAAKPQFFQSRLVGQIQGCRGRVNLAAFAGCMQPQFVLERVEAMGGRLDWLAPAPTYQIWSGVRELPYSVGPDFSFMYDDGSPMWPFSFMVQVAIDSPAYFVEGSSEWFSEENPAVDEYVDPDPWEFVNLAPTLNQTIANGIAASAERQSVYSDMREFAFMQRFFRVALDGRLGPGFPLEEFVAIDEATASAVDRSNRTLRWNVRPGVIEQNFSLELAGSADPGAEACMNLIDQSIASGGGPAVAAIDQTSWNGTCGAAVFSESTIASRAEQISAIRELRESLGVREDDALAYGQLECPLP